MTIESDIEFMGKINAQRLTSLGEDFKKERAVMLADKARFVKYGTNSKKKAALLAGAQEEELSRERFPEED